MMFCGALKLDSSNFKAVVKLDEPLFYSESIVCFIHTGLECGLSLNKYPNMDMISFGPTLRDVHLPDEKINIETALNSGNPY
ncbi:hypothetical protein [Ancylomarina sp. 16SWW S1-10-2]|uniref:hypothetical protein n=1 Tax=Ancylomarina sp. 16SWW S1-10-2 TaxID=2499681 RepID=UPI0012ADF1A8|nr:hypothetical protein [Ancylomarina sp. 16SWW S1-10-2]MRT94409.1 hypothetical protein [Ancylomarina sp. 16SWW S1-10-2]